MTAKIMLANAKNIDARSLIKSVIIPEVKGMLIRTRSMTMPQREINSYVACDIFVK